MAGTIQMYVNGMNGIAEQVQHLAGVLDTVNRAPDSVEPLDRDRVVKRCIRRAKELEGRLAQWHEELEEENNNG